MTQASNSALETLRKRIREQMDNLSDDIALGGCKTFEDYQKMTGILEGFARAERELLDLSEQLEKQ